MEIIDAHHHYWDPLSNNHPWLRDKPMIPFRYGDYSDICKPFMPPDYDKVAGNWNVLASVTMEGEWSDQDPLGEAMWMSDLNAATGKPAAHVSQAWLNRPDLQPLLEKLAGMSIVRSVRQKPLANATPGGAPGGMTEQAFIDGFMQLKKHGLHFDLQTPWWHLDEAITMAGKSSDTLIVLNHTGLPSDRSVQGLQGWFSAMQRLSALEQVRVKISGLGIANSAWTVADNREVVLKTIDLFGVERCMFASNFPVDGLCASFDDIYGGFNEITCDFSDSEREALFKKTAAVTYGLSDES